MDGVIPPLGEHDVVLLLVQLAALLLTARALGQLALRFRLPSVVGELSAGVLLGPSLLGLVAPGLFRAVVPADPAQFHLLEVVSLLGVLMLLVVTGMETDLDLIRRQGRTAAIVSVFGIVVPFGGGVALGLLLPEQFVADPSQRMVFSLFVGTAMGISAIPVIAKVLIELGVVRRDIGQVTLAAGMIDDTIGWILLSVVAGLARSGGFEASAALQAVLAVVLVVGAAFTAGRRLVAWLLRSVDNAVGGEAAKITVLMGLALTFGSVTHFLGIEAVLGAFLAGLLVGRVKRFDRHSREVFEAVTFGVFAPIFFAASGLRVDLRALADPVVLAVGALSLAVAIMGKFVGAAIGGRLAGMGRWESLSLGAGMNARGAIEIVVATIGLGLGILTAEMYTIVLAIAIVTSLMAPPLLRFTLGRTPIRDDERARLDAEDRHAASLVGSLHRVLLPSRGGANSQLAAWVVGALSRDEEIEITLMHVEEGRVPALLGGGPVEDRRHAGPEARLDAVQRLLEHVPDHGRRRVVERHDGGDPVQVVASEARRGYDLLAIGAGQVAGGAGPDQPLFGGFTDRLLREVDVPALVVSRPGDQRSDVVTPVVHRVLVPTAGGDAGRRALEVAAAVTREAGAELHLMHVTAPHGPDTGVIEVDLELGRDLLGREREHLRALGVKNVVAHVLTSTRVEQAIVAQAAELGVDLIVLAAERRQVADRAFFGHRAEHVLRRSGCPVVVLS